MGPIEKSTLNWYIDSATGGHTKEGSGGKSLYDMVSAFKKAFGKKYPSTSWRTQPTSLNSGRVATLVEAGKEPRYLYMGPPQKSVELVKGPVHQRKQLKADSLKGGQVSDRVWPSRPARILRKAGIVPNRIKTKDDLNRAKAQMDEIASAGIASGVVKGKFTDKGHPLKNLKKTDWYNKLSSLQGPRLQDLTRALYRTKEAGQSDSRDGSFLGTTAKVLGGAALLGGAFYAGKKLGGKSWDDIKNGFKKFTEEGSDAVDDVAKTKKVGPADAPVAAPAAAPVAAPAAAPVAAPKKARTKKSKSGNPGAVVADGGMTKVSSLRRPTVQDIISALYRGGT